MEETAVAQCLQFSSGSVMREAEAASLTSRKDVTNREISFCLEDAIVIDSVLPYIDSDSGQMIFSGLLDRNSTLFEGVQLAALVIDEPNGTQDDAITHQTNSVQDGDLASENTRLISFSQHPSSSAEYITGNLVTCLDQGELSQLISKQSNAIPSIEQPSVLLTITTSSTPNDSNTVHNEPTVVSSKIVSSLENLSSQNIQQLNDNKRKVAAAVAENGPYTCPSCEKSFTTWLTFKNHKQEHLLDKKPFLCSICGCSFNYDINLKLHVMLHDAETSGCLECQVCSVKFSRLASLKSHLRVHEKDEMCICEECGDEFSLFSLYKLHLEEHKTKMTVEHKCKFCNKSFNQAVLLKEHSKEHTEIRKQLKVLNTKRRKPRLNVTPSNNPVEGPSSSHISQGSSNESPQIPKLERRRNVLHCSVCDKGFRKPSQLQRHLRIHTGEKPFKCTQCDKSFNQKGTLGSHIKSMHEKARPFVCNLCSCTFSQRGNLRQHVKKVHAPPGENEKAFICKECSCVFRRLATLNNHISKVHSAAPQKIPSSSDAGELSTFPSHNSTSDLQLDTIDALNQGTAASSTEEDSSLKHDSNSQDLVNPAANSISEVTTDEKEGTLDMSTVKVQKAGQEKWQCTYCPKSMKKRSDLIRHVRTHTLEKPFKCNLCFKAFAVKSTLNTHMQTHSAEKKWKCRHCLKAFSVLASLRTHEQRLHSNTRPFKCTFEGCSMCFKTSSQRRSHMRVHTRNTQGLTGKRKLLRIGEATKKIDLPDALKITPNGLVPVPTRCALSSTAKYPCDTKSRPYRCPNCPSAFKKSSHLKQHALTHSGVKPFQCFQCSRRFVSVSSLRIHIKTVHQRLRLYKCGVCEVSFTTGGSLRRHSLTTHSNSRPYLCPFEDCRKSFKTNVSCRKHIKIHYTKGDYVALNGNGGTTNQTPSIQRKNSNGNILPPTTGSEIVPQLSNYPLTIQVSSKSSQSTGSVVKPVTVSKVTIPIIHESPDTFNHTSGSTTEQSHAGQLSFNQLEPVQLDVSTEKFEFPTMTTPSIMNSTQKSTQLVYNVQLVKSSDEKVFQQYETIPPQPQALRGTSNPTIIEITSSQKKTDDAERSVNKVAVTKFRQTASLDNVGVSTLCAKSAIPVKATKMGSNHPVILKTESIALKYLANRNSQCSTLPTSGVLKLEEPTKTHNSGNDQAKVNVSSQVTDTNNITKGSVKKIKTSNVNQCTTCAKVFKKRSDLIRHFRIHTGDKPFRCHICSKSFRVKSTRDAHLRVHEGTKTEKCEVCHNMFATRSSLKLHMRLHTNARPFHCTLCESQNHRRTFRTCGHLQAHIKTHAKPQKQRKSRNDSNVQNQSNFAPVPDRSTTSAAFSQNMYNLPQKSTGNLVIPKDISGQIPSSSAGAGIDYLHLLGNLPIDALQNIQISDISTLPAEDFLQSFILITPSAQGTVIGSDQTGSQTATMDIIEGTGIPNTHIYNSYSSNYIDQNQMSMDNSYVSEKPLLVNNSINNFQSPINGSDPFLTVASEPCSSTLSSNIISKQKKGSGNAPGDQKSCPDCGRTFSKPSLMFRHRRSHTGEKPHVCPICQSTFSQKSSLDTHTMFTHSDVRPFKCTLCPFQTVQKAALKKHCARAHPQLQWTELAEKLGGNTTRSPGISIVNTDNQRSTTVTTTQINITTGIRDHV